WSADHRPPQSGAGLLALTADRPDGHLGGQRDSHAKGGPPDPPPPAQGEPADTAASGLRLRGRRCLVPAPPWLRNRVLPAAHAQEHQPPARPAPTDRGPG